MTYTEKTPAVDRTLRKTRHEDEKIFLLFLVHLIPPVSIDTLITLSGYRPSEVINIMESLRKKDIVFEKKDFGKGFYFLNDLDVQVTLQTGMSYGERRDTMRKIINFYLRSSDRDEDTIVALADLYAKLGEVTEGLPYIKKAADILSGSGQRKKARDYYDHIIQQFPRTIPEQGQAEDYLDSVYKRCSMIPIYMPEVQFLLPLLERALQIADHYKFYHLAGKIQIILACNSTFVGKHAKTQELVNKFWKLARRLNDEELTTFGVLMTSISMVLKGSLSEAIDYYEKMTGGLEKFGNNEQELLAKPLIAFSHIVCGRIARGMGMIDAVRAKAESLNFKEAVGLADITRVIALITIRKTSEAEFHLENLRTTFPDNYIHITTGLYNICKAYILYTKQDYKGAFDYLKKGEPVTFIHHASFGLECLHALESKGYFDEKINFESEIKKMLTSNNLYMQGIALRHRAISAMKKEQHEEAILSDLKLSEKYLKKIGANIELARTWISLGNYYLAKKKKASGKSNLEKARVLLSGIDKDLFPKDLLEAMPWEQKIDIIIDRITTINRSFGTVKGVSSFLERIINAVMDFTMASRGAFLILKDGEVKIIAGRNFPYTFFDKTETAHIREVIIDAIKNNKELIIRKDNSKEGVFLQLGITSLIGMPVRIANHQYGYLVLDSQINETIFSEHSISFARMFASQMALGLFSIESYKEARELKEQFQDEAIFYKKREMGMDTPHKTIIGQSEGIRKLMDQVQQVAPTDSTVLILGETGVGKELVTKAIHNLSNRRNGPFIPVNLTSLPQDLVASELFGHEKGAFTGAHEKRKGRFELADGGTIFLDEIGDLPFNVQTKLLRVLQEGTFERLGKATAIRSDFRVIAATNKDLRMEVEKGTFRQDLYYRLNAFPIFVPPLRERKEDIPMLTQHFVDVFSKKLGKKIRSVPLDEVRRLASYNWPGNVRELEHVMERAVILSNGGEIRFSGFDVTSVQYNPSGEPVFMKLEDLERQHIEKALNATRWRITGPKGAANLLGLNRGALRHRMKKLGIGEK